MFPGFWKARSALLSCSAASLFCSVLFLLGFIIYSSTIKPTKRLRKAIGEFGILGFSKVVKDSPQWDIVKNFLSASFAEDSKFGGNYDFYIEEIHKCDDYNGFVVLFQNIITHDVPFLRSGRIDVINWPGSFMFVVVEPTLFEKAVFIRRRLNGHLMIPGKIVGRGRSAEELKTLWTEVHEIQQHLTEEFKRFFGAYEVTPLGDSRRSRLPSELQNAFIGIANFQENMNIFDTGVSDFGGYVKFLPKGFIIHVAYRKMSHSSHPAKRRSVSQFFRPERYFIKPSLTSAALFSNNRRLSVRDLSRSTINALRISF